LPIAARNVTRSRRPRLMKLAVRSRHVGSEVGPDTVVCIIEAMKVMNEIKAETRGVITAIVAENGKPVEFGQTLFKIRPL
jgi:biotin carboxyl carrier protein